ncbi:MAG: hypothetical protein AAF333_01750 [Planctomycetota bacterium]
MPAINAQLVSTRQPLTEIKETRNIDPTRLERKPIRKRCCVKICRPRKCENKYFKHLQQQFDKLQAKAGYLKDHGHCMSKCKLAKQLVEMRKLAKSVRWTIKQLPCHLQRKYSAITKTANDIAGKLHGANKCNARSKFHCVKPALCDALDLRRPTCRPVIKPWCPPIFPGRFAKL